MSAKLPLGDKVHRSKTAAYSITSRHVCF
jgi:hypothetical protein